MVQKWSHLNFHDFFVIFKQCGEFQFKEDFLCCLDFCSTQLARKAWKRKKENLVDKVIKLDFFEDVYWRDC